MNYMYQNSGCAPAGPVEITEPQRLARERKIFPKRSFSAWKRANR